MSKLEELINQLCPDGVEYRELWELTIWDKKFNSVDRHKQPTTIKYEYLLATDLKAVESDNGTVKILTTSITDLWANEEDVCDIMSDSEIVCIPWGGNPIVQYYNGKFITGDNRIATSVDKNLLSNKFLYYLMLSKLKEISSFYRGSGIKHPDMAKVLDLKIPLPSLPIQEEIVRILDSMTSLTAELTAQLTAELKARQKQYEYYRDLLLRFEEDDAYNRVRWMRLGEVATVIDSLHQTPKYTIEGYPMIRITDVKGGYLNTENTLKVSLNDYLKFTKNYEPQHNDIVISRVGSYGNFCLIPQDTKCCLGQNTSIIAPNINKKYLYYYLHSNNVKCFIESNVNGAGHKSFTLKQIKEIPVAVPSELEQQHIVDVLDRFDKLCNDISEGLPAEIEARKKQYEYYRDKLLTFKEVHP